MKTLAPTAVILAALAYLAVTEPGTPAAQPAADAPTVAAPVQAATIINDAQPAPTLAVRWFRTDAEADAESLRTGKPRLRLVTSPVNCSACVRLEAGPLSDAETVRFLNANYVMTQRRPYVGERISIPAFEVRTVRGWRAFNAPTFANGPFRNWLRGLFR